VADPAENRSRPPNRAANAVSHRLPVWLVADLRSDHAGETGAVMIYRGVLAVSKNPEVIAFARHHLATEERHLSEITAYMREDEYTRLLPLWRVMGWLTGALPALFGAKAVYATIDAVETFVDHHYEEQIQRLDPIGRYAAVRATLVDCRNDEIAHRDEARGLAPRQRGLLLKGWTLIVGAGSAVAVWFARRI